MRTTSSEPKDNLGRSGKGLITAMGRNTIVSSKKNKKAMYLITNVSLKEISKIVKEFDKLPYLDYVKKRPKYEPTYSYLYLSIQIAKCILRADNFNSHVNLVRTEMTRMQDITISQVCD